MKQKVYKGILLPLVLLMLAPSYLFADEAPALETQKQKESYSIGYQVGFSLKADGVEVDSETLIQGLQDAVGGKEPLLTNEEMRSLIVERREKVTKDQQQKLLEIRAQNADEAVTFLEENGIKDGIKTTESGLQYQIIKEGTGNSPKPDDMISVHYRGTFIDGTEFDSSYSKGKPQLLQADNVIPGLREALQMMKVGSKWKIFVPPSLAYGRGGAGQMVPPNKLLIFEIELLSIEKKQDKEG